MTDRDWRLPEHRQEAFQRFYSFHLKYKLHPGMVYSFLPAIAEAMDLDDEQKAWLVWINGNTQNAVTSLMILEAAPTISDWKKAIAFWDENFKLLEWDTDRRHQKSKFGEATEKWVEGWGDEDPDYWWRQMGSLSWGKTWQYAFGQPYMGRLSSWSMIEYARILFGPNVISDSDTWLLSDVSGSRSHRNGLAVIAGFQGAENWEAETPGFLGIVEDLRVLGDDLLADARRRNPGQPDVGRLTMESALCTYKSWHKPERRYPNVYSDMMYNRIRKAEARFNRTFDLLWETRKKDLPQELRLEDNPFDPGMVAVKQNHYLLTGQPIMMDLEYPDMKNDFNDKVDARAFGMRVDPKW